MPPLVPQPGVLKVEHKFRVGEDLNASARLFFKYSGGPPSNADAAAIASEFRSAWNNAWLGHLSNQSAHLGATVTDLTTPTSAFGESLITSLGTASTAPLPGGVALLMNLPIARRYRGGKPRVYWPTNVAADLTDPQTWNAGVLTTMTTEWQTSYLDVVIGFTSGTTVVGEQVNISYYLGFTAVENPITGRWKNVSWVTAPEEKS